MSATETAATCAGCAALLDDGAAFCASCGRPVGLPIGSDGMATVGAVQPAPPLRPSAVGSSFLQRDRGNRIARASKMLLFVSILFALFGTGFGLYQRFEAFKTKQQLVLLDPNQMYEVEGKSYTVAELKEEIDREVFFVFAVNYFLAVVMFGLFLWSRRSALPAMVTGLCVYLAVIALNAALDPATLVQGIIIKVLFIGALVAGIRAALEERDAGARTS